MVTGWLASLREQEKVCLGMFSHLFGRAGEWTWHEVEGLRERLHQLRVDIDAGGT